VNQATGPAAIWSLITRPVRKKEMGTKLGTKELSGRIKRNLIAIATRARRLCYLPRRKGAGLPLARGLRRSGGSNVAAVRHLIEMKLSVIKVGVKCAFLVQEVNGHLIVYRYPNCSPGPGRRYPERRRFSCYMQYRQYPPIHSPDPESPASS